MKIQKSKKTIHNFLDVYDINDYEIETNDGWKDIVCIGKTIKYNVYELLLEDGIFLKCADDHIVIQNKNNIFIETFVKDLKKSDVVVTKKGLKKVLNVKNLNYSENMYDIEINSNNHIYYTNDILSHNSTWLCNLAAKSIQQGYNTAYVTLELQKEIVNMRIGSNLLNIPMDDYEKITEDQNLLKQKLTQFKQKSLKPLGQLHIKEFPSSTASSNDIASYLIKAQELLGYKFDNIFIDYVNIMKNWRNPNTENTYMKIKHICEDIRAVGQINNWCVISCTQTTREGIDNNELRLSNISESIGLLHTVDLLFGIITTPEMKAAGEYYLKCLANRVAGYENTKKRYTVDWKYMRIEEDRMSPIQDIDFMVNNMLNPEKHKTPRGHKPPTMHEVISTKTQTLEQTPDNKFVGDINISGDGLF